MASMGSYKGIEIPAGSTEQQIQAIMAKADGVPKKTELSGSNAKTPAETVSATDRISNFGAALNVAIDKGRQQRKDTTLDFMNGVVPPGALPASSFAQVLKQFNNSSAPMEATLMEGAMDFAAEQEKIKVDTQNSIRQLALDVGKNGGSQDMVNAISALVESGDIDAAIKIGATALAKKGGTVSDDGKSLVTENADGSQSIVWSDMNFVKEKMADVKAEMGRWLPPDVVNAITFALTDEQTRAFMDDWQHAQAEAKQSLDPIEYFEDWKARNSIGAKKSTESTTPKVEVDSDEFLLYGPSGKPK